MNDSVKKIALVRGDSLNFWEGSMWHDLPAGFEVTGICSNKNLYPIDRLKFFVKKIPSTTDNKFYNRLVTLSLGVFQGMTNLEDVLTNFSLAHTTEIYNYYTYQAVKAKEKNKNLKVVTTVWDNSFGRFEQKGYWKPLNNPLWWKDRVKDIIKTNASGVDKFLAVSEYSASLLKDYGVDSNKIRVITPAIVDIKMGSEEIIGNLGLKGKEIYMMVNRLKIEKGVYDVLYAWKIFLQTVNEDNAVLLIVGDGPERENMLKFIKDNKLEKYTKYIKSLPNEEVRQIYPFAKALILASHPTPLWQEQFGYVMAEAITAGCPVVGAMSGSIPEVVGEAGLLFPPGNPVELAETMLFLGKDELYGEIKDKTKEVSEKFSAQRFKKELLEVYSELL